jgi:hypothetical protein
LATNRAAALRIAEDIEEHDKPMAERLRRLVAFAEKVPLGQRLELATIWRDGGPTPGDIEDGKEEVEEQRRTIRKLALSDGKFLRAFAHDYYAMSLAEGPPDEDFDRIEKIATRLIELEREGRVVIRPAGDYERNPR